MTHARLRRSLLSLMLVLLFVWPLALLPTAASSAAISSTTIPAVEARAPQLAILNWNGWQNLGDLNGQEIMNPVIGQNQDGHLEILAWAYYGSGSKDYAVYRRNQTAVNGTSWTAWASLGTLEPGTSNPVVATNPAGRMEVFVNGLVPLAGSCTYRSAVKHIYQTAPNNGWSSWGNLGQPSGSCLIARQTVGMNEDGRLDVFAFAGANNVFHRWQTAPSGNWSAGWSSIGAPPSGVISSRLSVGNNADGRLALFLVGNDSELYHNWQTTVNDENNWNGWTGFGKPSSSIDLYSATLGQNLDGRLDVFAHGTDDNLWHKWQVAPNSYWSGWENLGQPATAGLSGDLRASRAGDGRQVVFAPASDGAIWSIAQTQASGYWGSWTSLGKPPGVVSLGSVAVGQNKDGSLVVAAVGTYSGVLWLNYASQ